VHSPLTLEAERLGAALADRYRVERELGQGGMATVYLAHDIRHDRDVAIKVLHEDLGATLGPERFLAEIKTTAKLQHPHILPLLDSGEAGGLLFYVMPFVDGETLRERLTRDTQLPIADGIRIAREVADALGAAHAHGIIHRDIKPENILLQGGHALVADFGIALAVQHAGGQRMTQTGLSLGTPQYMSPEQAMGEKAVDHRADIYALGAVTYEMLTGDPPFTGSSVQAVVAKVLSAEPERPTLVRKTIPPNVERALLTALAKVPADRFQSAADFAAALADGASLPLAAIGPSGLLKFSNRWPVALAGWGAAALLAAVLIWKSVGSPSVEPARSLRFALSPGGTMGARIDVEISPDGRRILLPWVTRPVGGLGLAVRELSTLEARALPIPGLQVRVSPDGRWISYRVGGILRKIPVDGGTPATISSECGEGASWLTSDALACTTSHWGLGRVSSAGGPVEVLALPDTAAGEIGLWSADALPGGNAVVFTSYRRPVTRIEAFDIRSRARHVLVENAVMARYARSGHLLFVRDNALFAIRFDPKTLRSEGTAVPVIEDVASNPSDAVAGFAISDNGTLVVIRQSERAVASRLTWVDRQGAEQPTGTPPGDYSEPRISPDRTAVVLTVTTGGHRNVWLYDVRRALLTQLTRSTASAFGGIWTPDARDVVYTNETPSYDMYRMHVDGSAPPTPVISSIKDKFPGSVTSDGTQLVFAEEWAGMRRVMLGALDGKAPTRSLTDSAVHSDHPSFSPDGRWVAYGEGSDASKQSIFARRADGSGGKLQVSSGIDVDDSPRWTKGGREIVFRRKTAVYAVDIDVASGTIGVEHKLFDGPYPVERGYDVTGDGARFLMVRVDPRPEALPILVITNFFDELRKKTGR
jgi:tRNA A-37 threonylcarbamoyl transferase component Bud32